MLPSGSVVTTDIGTIETDGSSYQITLHTAHDGIEYVGRLWFTDQAFDGATFPDRGILPGRTETEVLDMALRLTDDELAIRFRRGNAEKRRYHALRRLTIEILDNIRYMNRVAVSLRKGLIDLDSGSQEIEYAEDQLKKLVLEARYVAGIEG